MLAKEQEELDNMSEDSRGYTYHINHKKDEDNGETSSVDSETKRKIALNIGNDKLVIKKKTKKKDLGFLT